MLREYTLFYRAHGIRRLLELLTPRVTKFQDIALPKNSIYHHDLQSESLGPLYSSTLFAGNHQKMPVVFVDQLGSELGVQKRKIKIFNKEIHQFINTNKHKFVYERKFFSSFKMASKLGLISYTLLQDLYHYRVMPLTRYMEWYNLSYTQYLTADVIATHIPYHQFIVVNVPYNLPSLSQLRLHQAENHVSMLRIFSENISFNVLDIWRFIDPETRPVSSMATMNKDNWKYINLIFNYQGLCYIVNLGQFMSYSEGIGDKEPQVKPHQLQKIFLRSLLALHKEYEIMETQGYEEIKTTEIEDPESIEPLNNDEGTEKVPDEITNNNNTNDIKKNNDIEENKILNDVSDLLIEDKHDELKDALDTIDKDLEEIEVHQKILHAEDQEDLNPETPEEAKPPVENKEELVVKTYLTPQSSDEKIRNQITKYREKGVLNNTDYKSAMRSYEKFQTMKNPYKEKSNLTYNEYATVKPEEIQITKEEIELHKSSVLVDSRMAEATVNVLDKKYINNVMNKDTLRISKCFMNAGLLIDDYQIDKHNDALGPYDIHTIKIKPVIGPASTIHFKVPVVNEDGEMTLSGKKYYLRKQRQDLPIRKINDRQVALTSYYGKTFVNKDEKVVNNLSRWLGAKIRKEVMDDNSNIITKAISTNVFDPDVKVPRLYSALAQQFLRLETKDIVLYFDYLNRDSLITKEGLDKLEKDGRVFVGYEKKTKYPLFMNFKDQIEIYDGATYKLTQSFYQLVGIDVQDTPLEFTTINIFSKSIPVIMILGYLMGLDNILTYLKPEMKVLKATERYAPTDQEYVVKFKDIKYIFNRSEIKNTLLLAGLLEFDKLNKKTEAHLLNDKDIYYLYFKELGLNSIYIKETDLYNDLFIDPITHDVLVEMKEPTTFIGLLFRSVEMLVLDAHPASTDMDYMRIRSYERIPGIVYKEMVNSIRDYRNRSVTGKSPYSMNPFAVWRAIGQDAGVSVVSDINPIQNLKQQEGVTYSGTGGRSKDTIVAKDRVFNKSDIGVISEATADSSDAGANTYLSANPSLKNLRGMKGDYTLDKVGSAGVLSTSAANAVAATNDDPKRTNFISIQNSHTVGCAAYRQSAVRTGYETIIPQRTKSLFCKVAEQKAKVISRDDNGIIIEYKDGSRVGMRLGRLFGNHEGSSFPHDIESPWKEGDTIEPGMAIGYNTNFFEPDILDPRFVVYKGSLSAKVALMESQYTLEDSSAMSTKLSQKLATWTTHTKSVVINFNQNIHKPHPLGPINYGDVLCYIEDEITSDTGVFSEDNIETLKSLAMSAPKSKYTGRLDRIEVKYHGDKPDMSNTLRKLADASDNLMKKEAKSSGTEEINGSITSDYRVDGNPLLLDTAEIKFYISVFHGMGIGDKNVVAHQEKSVIGGVYDKPIYTENGDEVDLIFGAQSIANRIVMSPYILGTTETILKKIAKNAVSLYKTGKI